MNPEEQFFIELVKESLLEDLEKGAITLEILEKFVSDYDRIYKQGIAPSPGLAYSAAILILEGKRVCSTTSHDYSTHPC